MPAIKVTTIKKKAARKLEADRKPLLSHSTVLILSGFLIGMAFRKITDPGLEFYAFVGGLVGIIGYVILDHVSQRRRQRAAQLEIEQTNSDLERRLNRHISGDSQVQSGSYGPENRFERCRRPSD